MTSVSKGGNVAARILPVQIHDLNVMDRKLVEDEQGGYLRGIEFIYKEPGVNRPLRSNEDNPHDNLNHTIYRNQINKVALSVKDIIESMKITISPDQAKIKEIQVKELIETKEIKVKEPDGIVSIKSQKAIQTRKVGFVITGILLTIVILETLIFLLNRHLKIKWAKERALTEIEQLINKANVADAFRLVQKAEKYISKDPRFQELSSLASSKITNITDPSGADVFIREYSDIEGKWEKLGKTPINNAKIPGSKTWWTSSLYLTRIEKPGYEDILAVTSTTEDTLYRKLFKQGT